MLLIYVWFWLKNLLRGFLRCFTEEIYSIPFLRELWVNVYGMSLWKCNNLSFRYKPVIHLSLLTMGKIVNFFYKGCVNMINFVWKRRRGQKKKKERKPFEIVFLLRMFNDIFSLQYFLCFIVNLPYFQIEICFQLLKILKWNICMCF